MMLNNPSAILTVKRSYLIGRLAQYSNIEETIASLSIDDDTAFDFKPVCHREVLNELNSLRSDCSTGPDNIPAKLLRLVAEYLASPITNIINCYSESTICAIPKGNEVTSERDLRPISILPVMSKVYERLLFWQLNAFIEEKLIINNNISAYRKGQSTITVLQTIQDDVIEAMGRGEVAMMVLAVFSKAFDTVKFSNLITKMSKLGLSKQCLR